MPEDHVLGRKLYGVRPCINQGHLESGRRLARAEHAHGADSALSSVYSKLLGRAAQAHL
jgi:hypothetical protein